MKNSITLLLIVFSGTVFGQYTCNLEKNETDAVTGKKVKETDWVKIVSLDKKTLGVKINQIGNQFQLEISFNFTSEITGKEYSIEKGMELKIKLDNNDMIITNAFENAKGKTHVEDPAPYKVAYINLKVKYLLTEEQIKQLNSSPVKSMVISVLKPDNTKKEIEKNIDKDKKEVLRQMIACLKANK